jgi:hypothetical protein
MQTAKQIPKQDLKITSKIKPKDKKQKTRQTNENKQDNKTRQNIHKKGEDTEYRRARIDVRGWDLEESRAGVLEHTRINGIWDAYRAKGIIKHGNRTFRFCWGFCLEDKI